MKQSLYTRFITNNQVPFLLWWNKIIVICRKLRKCYDRDCRIGMKHLQTPSENKFFSASTVKIAFTVVAVLTVCTNPITETSEALYNSGTINHTGISIITLTIFLHVLVPSIMILSLTLLKISLPLKMIRITIFLW